MYPLLHLKIVCVDLIYRMIQQAFIDMENMFDLLGEDAEVIMLFFFTFSLSLLKFFSFLA